MNNEEREKLKKYLPDYLQSKGIDYIHNKLFRCLSPYHEDNHPSMVYYPNRQVCHCFACGADLDIFAIIGIDYGISNFTEQIAKICEIYNIPNQSLKYEKPTYRRNYKTQKFVNTVKEQEQEQSTIPTDFSEYLSECAMYLEKAVKLNLNDINQFLDRRGLTLNTIKHFSCGLDPKWKSPKVTKENKIPYSPRFIIPSSKYGYLARDIRDRSSLSDFQIRTEKMKTGQLDLFNKTALNNAKGICFITEGEIDAMSVYQTGFDAVALGTTAMVNSFFKAIEDIGTNSIIIPLLDNDNAGKVTTEKIENGLKERGLSFYHINNFCLNAKDPNEALVKNTSWFYEWIRHTALCAWLENTKQDESKLSLNYIIAKTCATASVLNDQQDNVIFSSKLDITKNPVNIIITKTDDKGHSSVYMYNYENQNKTLKFNYGFDKTSFIKKQQIPCDVEKLIESCSNNIQKYLENKKSELYYEKSHS